MLGVISILSISFDIIAIGFSAAASIKEYARHSPFSYIYFDVVHVILILAGLRIAFFMPNIIKKSIYHKVVRWSSLYILWLGINAIFICGGCILLIVDDQLNAVSFNITAIVISFLSTLCQFVYIRYSGSRIRLRLDLSHDWSQLNIRSLLSNSKVKRITNISSSCIDSGPSQALISVERGDITIEERISDAIFALNDIGKSISGNKRYDCLDLLINIYEYEGQTLKPLDYQRILNDTSRIFSLDKYDSNKILIFIPQITTYIIMGSTPLLQDAVKENLSNLSKFQSLLSHRMHWFLIAFCLFNSSLTDLPESLRFIFSLIEENGELATQREISGEFDDTSSPPTPIKGANASGSKMFDIVSSINSEQKIENINLYDCELQPLSPSTPSKRNTDDEKMTIASSSYPMYMTIAPSSTSSYFSQTLLFWGKLSELATSIFRSNVPRNSRTDLLRSLLVDISSSYLPSSCIHAPVGHGRHRIWSIRIDESFAFSTKARAPIFLCLEVVDYITVKNKSKKSWWEKSRRLFRESIDSIVERGSLLAKRVNNEFSISPDVGPLLRQSHSGKNGSVAQISNISTDLNQNKYEQNLSYGSVDQTLVENSPLKFNSCLQPNTKSESFNDDLFGQWSSPGSKVNDYRSSQEIKKKLIVPVKTEENNNNNNNIKKTAIIVPSQVFSYNRASNLSNLKSLYGESIAGIDLMPKGNFEIGLSELNEPGFGLQDEQKSSTESFDQILPPVVLFKENWKQKENRIRISSPVGNCPGYRLLPVIVKSLDDLRQEQIISQQLYIIDEIFKHRGVDCWIRPYEIVALSRDSGVIEAIPDSASIDVLRRNYPSLETFFQSFFFSYPRRLINLNSEKPIAEDSEDSNIYIPTLTTARENFMKSIAGYSIVSYLLQIKDRHNGNILVDIFGHIIHIDFGFVLGITPGGNIGFENAPFKLTAEMVQVLGGSQSFMFNKFRNLCIEAFMALRRDHHRLVSALNMIAHASSEIPCFPNNQIAEVVEAYHHRFMLDLSDQEVAAFVHDLIDESLDNWTTTCYDRYQRCCVGIF